MRDRNIYHPIEITGDFVRTNAFELIIVDAKPLHILCKSLIVTMPVTNAVNVPWISGNMQLAGRITNPYSFNVSFLVGRDVRYDTLRSLYDWRNQVFDHATGRIALAHEYKKEATINIYDITADADESGSSIQYTVKAAGVWPTNIADINLSVEVDGVMEITSQFAADKIWIEKFGS